MTYFTLTVSRHICVRWQSAFIIDDVFNYSTLYDIFGAAVPVNVLVFVTYRETKSNHIVPWVWNDVFKITKSIFPLFAVKRKTTALF